MSVSREKYEKAKHAANVWYQKLEELKEKYSKLSEEKTLLTQTVEKLQKDVKGWKNLSENLPDNEELEDERRKYNKLRKKMELYKNRIATLERDNLLNQGKIQQLEEAKKDLRERYTELKQDYRDLNRREKSEI